MFTTALSILVLVLVTVAVVGFGMLAATYWDEESSGLGWDDVPNTSTST
jgi:hypothetical protein